MTEKLGKFLFWTKADNQAWVWIGDCFCSIKQDLKSKDRFTLIVDRDKEFYYKADDWKEALIEAEEKIKLYSYEQIDKFKEVIDSL